MSKIPFLAFLGAVVLVGQGCIQAGPIEKEPSIEGEAHVEDTMGAEDEGRVEENAEEGAEDEATEEGMGAQAELSDETEAPVEAGAEGSINNDGASFEAESSMTSGTSVDTGSKNGNKNKTSGNSGGAGTGDVTQYEADISNPIFP